MFLGAVHTPGHRTGLDILSDLGSVRNLPLCMLLPSALPSSPAVAHHVRHIFHVSFVGPPHALLKEPMDFRQEKPKATRDLTTAPRPGRKSLSLDPLHALTTHQPGASLSRTST